MVLKEILQNTVVMDVSFLSPPVFWPLSWSPSDTEKLCFLFRRGSVRICHHRQLVRGQSRRHKGRNDDRMREKDKGKKENRKGKRKGRENERADTNIIYIYIYVCVCMCVMGEFSCKTKRLRDGNIM
jgi:hypothetical protein